jgi:hypothetical protein
MDNGLFRIAERYGKKVIGYPEDVVPVVSTDDWIRQHITSDPLSRVSYKSSIQANFNLLATHRSRIIC